VKPVIDVLIDSGAYSAWRLGVPINLDEYCDFLIANRDWIWNYVSLDVINPGRPEEAAAMGRENYLHMRRRGLSPIPVFHAGESVDWLYRMVDDGATYIGLSASSIVSRAAVDDWYAFAFGHLCTAGGLPIVKTHAFGEGRESSLRQFPWYSADSASWIYAAQRTGTVLLESGHKLSCRKDAANTDAAPDIQGLDHVSRAALDEILKSRGINAAAFEDRGTAAYVVSTYCAALYYMGVQERVSAGCPIAYHSGGFFAPPARPGPAIDIPNMRMFLVSGGNTPCFGVIAKCGHTNMLSSYFHIKGGTSKKKASVQGKSHYKLLQDMCLDPIKAVSSDGPIKRYYDILTQHVK
jgi:hypothetical protein